MIINDNDRIKILTKEMVKFIEKQNLSINNIVDYSFSKNTNSIYVYLIENDKLYEIRKSDHRTTWTNLKIDMRELPRGVPIERETYIESKRNHVGKVIDSNELITTIMWSRNNITSKLSTYYINQLRNHKR